MATIFSHLTIEGSHPVNELRLVLKDVPPQDQPGTSPFRALDGLYRTILQRSPKPKEPHDILVAVLVLPRYLSSTPAHIGMLLGLPSGQAALTLRCMHSILHIRGHEDVIPLRHTPFRDHLLD